MSAVIDRIEALIQRDVGRGMAPIFQAAQGGLGRAASALAAADMPRIGLITGFYVPGGTPPAAETDGPGGTALLARAFTVAGLRCRLATDTICRSACVAALQAAGAPSVPVDVVAPGGDPREAIRTWRTSGIDWVIAMERCGPSADGHPRNMRGTDMSAFTAPLDQLFLAGPWRTIAIGDGGNEIGMGCISRTLIAAHVPLGETIGCIVPADHLIAAGVSHWGAYGLLAALSVRRPDWTQAMLGSLDIDLDRRITEAIVREGPAVDGITLRQDSTIDAMDATAHARVLADVRAAAGLTAEVP